MSLPQLPTRKDIHDRLQIIFPAGLEMRTYIVREMAANVVFVFLYGGMVEGSGRMLRPSHVYFYTEDQAGLVDEVDREHWFKHSVKPGFRPAGTRWYADTTKEPIRDETMNNLVNLGAMGKLPNVPTTSSKPTYWLMADFAALFAPDLDEADFLLAVEKWQKQHLSPAARARMALLSGGKVKKSDEVLVQCPDGTIAKLSPGPSSVISKDVVEKFAIDFLPSPALLWMSESGNKVRFEDEATAKTLGLSIDKAKVLPDIVLVNVGAGPDDTSIVFIEVVASDGPMHSRRKSQLLEYVKASGFPEDQCVFGTAFEDRADSAFRKCLPQLAWGTFAWFRSEPERIMWLADEPFDITE